MFLHGEADRVIGLSIRDFYFYFIFLLILCVYVQQMFNSVTTFKEGWQAVLKWEVYDTMPPQAAVTVCDIANTLRHF